MSDEVLIVENDESVRRVLRTALEHRYVVETAAGGQAALRTLGDEESSPPDVVLLDIMLPDSDGFEILRWIRNHSILADLPVVVVSARSREEDIRRALDAGATDFVTKPFETSTLRESVKRAVTDDHPSASSPDRATSRR